MIVKYDYDGVIWAHTMTLENMVSQGNARRWSWCLLKAQSLSNVADKDLYSVRVKPKPPNPKGKSSGRPQTVRRKPSDPGCPTAGGGSRRGAKAGASAKAGAGAKRKRGHSS